MCSTSFLVKHCYILLLDDRSFLGEVSADAQCCKAREDFSSALLVDVEEPLELLLHVGLRDALCVPVGADLLQTCDHAHDLILCEDMVGRQGLHEIRRAVRQLRRCTSKQDELEGTTSALELARDDLEIHCACVHFQFLCLFAMYVLCWNACHLSMTVTSS